MRFAACYPPACRRKRSHLNLWAINTHYNWCKDKSPGSKPSSPRNKKLAVTLSANKPGFEKNKMCTGSTGSATAHKRKQKRSQSFNAPLKSEHKIFSNLCGT